MSDPQPVSSPASSQRSRRVIKSIAVVGGATLVANLAAMAKEMLVAGRFGTGESLDALLVAFLPIGYAINVLTGAMKSAFTPTFIRVRREAGVAASERLVQGVLALTGAGLAILTALVGLSSYLLVALFGSGFTAETSALARKLLFIQLPFLMVSGLGLVWGMVLNALERFALVALAPAACVLVQCVVLLRPDPTIEAFATSLVVGGVVQSGIIFLGVKQLGLPARPVWIGWTDEIRIVLREFKHLALSMLVMGTTVVVDQGMAAMLGDGQVATLGFGTRLVLAGLGLAATSLGTVVLPHFSSLAAESEATLRRAGVRWMGAVFVLCLPVTALIVWFSEDIVRLVFERGAFTAADTRAVGQVQALYALQIPAYLAGIVGVRVLSAWRRNAALLWIGVFNLVSNVAGNVLLMPYLGVSGIALATSLMHCLATGLVLVALLQGPAGRAITARR